MSAHQLPLPLISKNECNCFLQKIHHKAVIIHRHGLFEFSHIQTVYLNGQPCFGILIKRDMHIGTVHQILNINIFLLKTGMVCPDMDI